jgi:hypothetical protein
VTDAELLVKLALACVGAQEVPAGSNAGFFTERCQKVAGNKKGDPWCASFVAMLGQTALGARWPLPLTGSCQALAEAAGKRGALTGPYSSSPGDLFVVWFDSLRRFGHVGVVVGSHQGSTSAPVLLDTVSGNTIDPVWHGSGDTREGWCVSHRPWHLKDADRIITWQRLLDDA